ncbi:oxidoreductase [Enterococcus sp. JM4C]|uniref:Gfo/Idh/MocA family protein n=1 Tax=Candidatus Enterococcus huntleyi TaxID=1857217 RepID=UPI0013797C37|nr:Gfo/Idh/MocA family oxidoreductase [Enterococcus sp. JM4C]KAF1295667.1 oxidoreductase [Enterococcus sp. JM4C]
MKFGVVGVGNIAQKAYLPSYSSRRDQGEFLFATRNSAVQEKLRTKFGFSSVYDTLDQLIEAGIEACFIHTATQTHFQLAKQCLTNNIHVFVDKPLSENLAEVAELQQLAKEKNLLLMVGFNRRFAPMVEYLKQQPNKRMIHLQKNRIAAEQSTDFVIYDLFLHLVDTAVYLLDEPIEKISSKVNEKDGNMQWTSLELETANQVAILSMDLVSGANTELYQVTTQAGTYTVNNLVDLQIQAEGQTTNSTFGDWETTLAKRGFEQLVDTFITGVKTGDATGLRQENVYQSHALCQEILHQFHQQSAAKN